MTILLTTILFLIATGLHAYADSYKDTTGKTAHITRAVSVIFYVASGYFSFVGILPMIGVCILTRTAFFNPLYNSFSNLPTFYTGSTDPLFDVFLSKLPNWLVFLVHMIALFLLIVINIHLW